MDEHSKTEAMYGSDYRKCTCPLNGLVRRRIPDCPIHGDHPLEESIMAARRSSPSFVENLRREEAEGRATQTPSGKISANSVQHGGDHYKSEYQHWDWAHDLRLNYFAATATAYVARNRRKNGAEDLLKAAHYCDKAEELGYGERDVAWDDEHQRLTFKFAAANRLTNDEYRIIFYIVTGSYQIAAKTLYSIIDAAQPSAPR